LKTIQEVAEILNVTPQAIYKKINNQFNNQLKDQVKQVKRGNKTVKVVTDKGIEILRESMEQPVKQQFNNEFNNVSQPLIDLLQGTIDTLNRQLEVKDKQIQDLSDRLKEQQELNRNNQILLHREQDQQMLPAPTGWERFKKFLGKE
jgi:flagellar capping protein FliD